MVAYIRGIDLSRWQEGPNNFRALRAGGFEFAVQRWGVGTYRDPVRKPNLEAIIAAGLIPGTYFVPGEHTGSGAQQAGQFLAEVRQAFGDHPMLLVLDAEHSNSFGDPSARQCIDFVATIHAEADRMALGYVPRWWMNGRGWTKSDAQAIRRHAIWWQSAYPATVVLGLPPVAFLGWEARLWQWTSSGHPPGIPGSVDLNVFYGSRDDLLALTRPPVARPPVPSVPAVPDAKRGKMLFLIKTQSRNEWWLTDWLTKRHMASREDANVAIVLSAGAGQPISTAANNQPHILSDSQQPIVDRIPRTDLPPVDASAG
jgi:lysozyme